MALPALRQELDLLPGPTLPDGQPSWSLHDPVRNTFFRVDWPTLEILQRWDMNDPAAIAHDVNAHTTLDIAPEDVQQVVEFLVNNQLVQTSGINPPEKLARRLADMQGTPLKWLLHHYLFFRIPLVKPDAWLQGWLPVARRFASPTFLVFTLLFFAFGLSQVMRSWDVFKASLVDTFSLEGLASYALALIVVKVVHELGHAFTSKHYGCRVPSMGVAFLVMWPMAYTDTNETWRLTNHKDRLRVASAGIATELVVAAWATAAWALLPEGGLKSAAFFLATTSWMATLAINASPFMRFDGYFMLMDAVDMPNLHGRSFALARWKLREWLFGLDDPAPEHFKPTTQRILIAFAWTTWLYRLMLFIGIAVLVYVFFFKLLGIVLFVVEIAWFIWFPIRSELKEWLRLWPRIKSSATTRKTYWAVGLMLLLAIVPWPGRIHVTALWIPQQTITLAAPAAAYVSQLPHTHGAYVAQGQPLLQLHMPELARRENTLQARLERERWQTGASSFNDEMRKRWMVNQDTVATTEAELMEVASEQANFAPVAPFDGTLMLADPDLHTGQWVEKRETLATFVANATEWRLETLLYDEDAARIEPGDVAYFVPDFYPSRVLKMTVGLVDQDASRTLQRKELASHLGGHITTREMRQQLVPERPAYRVSLISETDIEQAYPYVLRGRLVIHGRWTSQLGHYSKQVLSVLIRELSF